MTRNDMADREDKRVSKLLDVGLIHSCILEQWHASSKAVTRDVLGMGPAISCQPCVRPNLYTGCSSL